MKIKYFLLILLCMGIVAADAYTVDYTASATYKTSSRVANLEVQKLRYEPYPVSPGDYFDLYIQAENYGSDYTENAIFELLPEFPFYLDPNEKARRDYGMIGDEPVVLEYKVRVDKDAVEGTNKLEFRYSTDGKGTWVKKEFEVQVENVQTDFDIVLQEINGNELSIALANTGKNIAYSVITRIPEQENFKVTSTNGQMVGNLEDGDYTLVGFNVQKSKSQGKELTVQIDYTDTIGERRSVLKNVTLDIDSAVAARNATAMARTTTTVSTPYYQQWWFWVALLTGFYIISKIYAAIKRHLNRKKMEMRKQERTTKR